ncbi:MAG: hypothetical protein R2724_27855 [Bryobacterales bacterium]
MQKSGAWYSYGDERIGQGRENAKQFLKDNLDARDKLEKELRATLATHQREAAIAADAEDVDEEPTGKTRRLGPSRLARAGPLSHSKCCGHPRISSRRLFVAAGACNRQDPTKEPDNLPRIPTIELTRVSDEARQSIQSALDRLRQYPGDPLLNGELGMALHANRRYQEAAVLYDRARKIHPDVFRWEYYRGLVLSELNDVDEAAAPFPAGARDQQKTTRAPNWRWRAALLQERAHDG